MLIYAISGDLVEMVTLNSFIFFYLQAFNLIYNIGFHLKYSYYILYSFIKKSDILRSTGQIMAIEIRLSSF